MEMTYTPPPSLVPFLTSESMISLVCGPVGSTKTTAGIMRIAFLAKQMAPCQDGVRRSRCVWVRRSRQMLYDTSIKDFLSWFPDGEAGVFLKTDSSFTLRFDDVECEVLFRPMEDEADVNRLLSLQLSFGVLDEFREISPAIFEALQGRLGRYPDKRMVPHREEWGLDDKGFPVAGCVDEQGKSMKRLWGMTNPPDADTFFEDFLSNPPENAHVTIQPSGLSAEADWLQYLPANFYEDLAQGKTEAYINVYIHGKFGESLSGQPVFRCFNQDVHVAKQPLVPNRVAANPIIVGFDCTGLNPAAVIGQIGFEGRAYVYDTVHATDMGVLRFVREKLKPLLANKYAGMSVAVVVDPAGMSRDAEERTVKDMLAVEQLAARPASTNYLAPRIAAVENLLTRFVDGKPQLVIDPGCTDLITALRSKYRFKRNTKGELDDSPDKSHPWADIADAFQYFCLHADGGTIFGSEVKPQARQIRPAPFRYAR